MIGPASPRCDQGVAKALRKKESNPLHKDVLEHIVSPTRANAETFLSMIRSDRQGWMSITLMVDARFVRQCCIASRWLDVLLYLFFQAKQGVAASAGSFGNAAPTASNPFGGLGSGF
jgi:hypothetical protein